MINCVFWDLDETLIHSHNIETINSDFSINISSSYDPETYLVSVRYEAKEAVDFSRKLVGEKNVFILTAATRDYALAINKKAGFNFAPERIIDREWSRELYNTQDQTYYHPDNVLIDNLPLKYNMEKVRITGATGSNYLQIRDFYGEDSATYSFKDTCIDFLTFYDSE